MENIESIKEFVRTTFPDRLKTLRETIGVSQDTFAKRLGVSRAAIGYYEKGERIPDILFLEAVRELTGCSLNFLLGYSDNMMDCDNWSDFVMEYDLSDQQIAILQTALKSPFFKALLNHEEFLSFLNEMEYYLIWFSKGKKDHDFIVYKTISSLGNLMARVCEEASLQIAFDDGSYIENNESVFKAAQEAYQKNDTIMQKAEELCKKAEDSACRMRQEQEQLAENDPIARFRLKMISAKSETEERP